MSIRNVPVQTLVGDLPWNFEKFLVPADGEVVGRFRSKTDPEAAEVIDAIEVHLP
jgi:glutathione peroxidase